VPRIIIFQRIILFLLIF